MKHHIESVLIIASFLAFGLLSLSSVGIIVIALEVLSK
jgi:hypothetical protein